MTIEEPDKIDILVGPVDGKVILAIVDVGNTSDPQERYQKLLKKLQTYVGFAMSEEFQKKYPKIKPNDVEIEVNYYNTEPTSQMKQVTHVGPANDPTNAIKVKHILEK